MALLMSVACTIIINLIVEHGSERIGPGPGSPSRAGLAPFSGFALAPRRS